MPLININSDVSKLAAALDRVASAIETFNALQFGVGPTTPVEAEGEASVEYMTDEESLVASGLTFAEGLEARGYPAGEVRKLLDGYFDEKG